MKSKYKLRRLFFKYTIKKPIVYVFTLLIACFTFSIYSLKVGVPVYTTVTVTVSIESQKVLLSYDTNGTILDGTDIYIYDSRDENVWCVSDYLVTSDGILMDALDEMYLSEGDQVYVDVEKEKITLLEDIFIRGGK